MSRSVGLPCRTSPDTDQSSVSRSVRSRRSTTSRILRATSGGIVSLTLLSLLVPSSRPIASDYAVAPSAARFAAAGFVGLVGDASGIDDTATFSDIETVGGTLAFGDPITPPITLPALPGVPTPADRTTAPAASETTTWYHRPAPTEPVEPTPPPPETHEPVEPTPPPPEATPPPAAETPPPAEPTPPPTEDVGSVDRGTDASNFARTLVGKRYRYGASGPNSFDCSGLTMYVYQKFGVKLPHKASDQFSSRYGTVIGSMSDLQAGDLVFFKNTAGPGITHTAIYVGSGKMVSANTPRTGVQLNSIGESYWRKHWAGGLRLNSPQVFEPIHITRSRLAVSSMMRRACFSRTITFLRSGIPAHVRVQKLRDSRICYQFILELDQAVSLVVKPINRVGTPR